MRLKASPLRSGVVSPVTTSPAHREPPEAGGSVSGFYPCLLLCWLFSADFPTATKSRRKRTFTAAAVVALVVKSLLLYYNYYRQKMTED